MAYSLSPGVTWSERDLTTVVPQLATSVGAFAGVFDWGPVDTVHSVHNEVELVRFFGKPSKDPTKIAQARSFFAAANFLAYAENLRLVRANPAGAVNATNGSNNAVTIKNREHYETYFRDMQTANNYGMFAAKYPGELGNSLRVSVFPASPDVAANSQIWKSWAYYQQFGNSAIPNTSIAAAKAGARYDQMHIIVIDVNGKFTGIPGAVLEKFEYVSKASDAVNDDGSTNYYVDVLAQRSDYIWAINHAQNTITQVEETTTWGTPLLRGKNYTQNSWHYTSTLSRGSNGSVTEGQIMQAYDMFKNAEEIDIALIITGDHSANVIRYVIDSIVDGGETLDVNTSMAPGSGRKDCVVFVSPPYNAVIDNAGREVDSIIGWKDEVLNTSSSYAFMDSGWKRQFDKYNDTYRWLPLNPDIAGLCARTDSTREPWFSPAGLERGRILNCASLSWTPIKAERDDLYSASVNPVINVKGTGAVLWGDKTLTNKPSAFDRINVRRLFINLEKRIAQAARQSLFEFNDEFTRAQFVALVEPFLRDVKGKRGIYDYRVVCDETNNTPEVIDTNRFVGDIYIKPARSINFIHLNFVAVRTGVAFSEVVGSF